MEISVLVKNIESIARKLHKDAALRQQFTAAPEAVVSGIVGAAVPADQVKNIVTGVKIMLPLEDAAAKVGEFLDVVSNKVSELLGNK